MADSGTPAPIRYSWPTPPSVVLVSAGSAQGDDERRDAALVEAVGMIEAGAENGRGPAIVLGGAKDHDGVGRGGLCGGGGLGGLGRLGDLVDGGVAVDLRGDYQLQAAGPAATSRIPAATNRGARGARLGWETELRSCSCQSPTAVGP